MELAKTEGEEVFKTYTSATLVQEDKQNLVYTSSTRDL